MDGTARTLISSYDAASNRTALTGDSGYSAGFAFDSAGAIGAYKEGGTLPVVSFAYDSAGRRSGLSMGSAAAISTAAYHYDAVGRLDSLTHHFAAPGSDQALTFGYNPASQMVMRTSSNDAYASNAAQSGSRAYGVNGLNQYTGTTSNGTPSATFQYDANGNLISDGANAYVYDAENRLVGAS